MHLIEQLLGVSPDNDSGLTELLIIAIPVVIFLILYFFRRRRNAAD